MFNALICGGLGVLGGAILVLWLLGREDPPPVQALTNPHNYISAENLSEFAEEWQWLEKRLEVSLGPDEAHHLLKLEEATKKHLFLVSVEEDKKLQNRMHFLRWLVANGRLTGDTIDELV